MITETIQSNPAQTNIPPSTTAPTPEPAPAPATETKPLRVPSDYSKRLLPPGMINASGAALFLGMSRMQVWRWRKQGRLVFSNRLISFEQLQQFQSSREQAKQARGKAKRPRRKAAPDAPALPVNDELNAIGQPGGDLGHDVALEQVGH